MYSQNDWRYYSDELMHYGILGQKWGVRRYQNADGSLTNAGRERYGKGGSGKKAAQSTEHGMDPVTAMFAFQAFTLVAPVIATVGVGAVNDIVTSSKVKKYEKERASAKIDKETGLRLKSSNDLTPKEDAERVNVKKGYAFKDSGNRHRNCTNCTMAYEMRRRGYEVRAKELEKGRDGYDFIKDVFPETSTKYISEYSETSEYLAKQGRNTQLKKDVVRALEKEPPGSRGQLLISWDRFSGHSLAYEITRDGRVIFVDSQNGKASGNYPELEYACDAAFQRLDNSSFDKEKIKEAVE